MHLEIEAFENLISIPASLASLPNSRFPVSLSLPLNESAPCYPPSLLRGKKCLPYLSTLTLLLLGPECSLPAAKPVLIPLSCHGIHAEDSP